MNFTAGTNISLIICDIIERQYSAGVKTSVFGVIGLERRLRHNNLQVTPVMKHKGSIEFQFETCILDTIREEDKALVSVSGHHVPFVGNSCFVIALNFCKI